MSMPSILMIAFHFPPLAGSSGIQRTLRYMQHLPALGWTPLVLSADPRAYERTNADLDSEVPAGTVVRRAFALDTARHLSLRGRYVGAMARPDRWVSWRFDAVRQGMRLIREFKPKAIWSTYPIATAHLIGAELHRRSGLPWIADFRDPMAQDGYPADPQTWQQFDAIEKHAIRHAAFSTFTTPGAARVYRERYPEHAGRIEVLENGYDESSFAAVEQAHRGPRQPLQPGTTTLLHSGIVYPAERDPTALMRALRLLADRGHITPGAFRIRFRAAVAEDLLRQLAEQHGVTPFIEICPPVGYKDALDEMLRADALLVMQASNCNEQIPAKAYEYLRARRPVICLSDPVGDTSALLRDAGLDLLGRLDDAEDIANVLLRFLQQPPSARRLPDPTYVANASRAGRTRALADLLNRAVG